MLPSPGFPGHGDEHKGGLSSTVAGPLLTPLAANSAY